MKRVPSAHWWQKRNWKTIVYGTGVNFVDPLNTYVDPTVEIARGTVVHPCTFVRGATEIGKDCTIGPLVIITDCKIGNDVSITDGAKVKRCVVEKNVNIPHECYLADATIGEDTNIGHGTGTSNFDGIKKNKTLIGPRCFIGTFVDIIAPVEIGEESFIASQVRLSAKNPIPPHSFVYQKMENCFPKVYWRENCAFKSPHHWAWIWTKKPIDPERMKELFNLFRQEIGDYREWLGKPLLVLNGLSPQEVLCQHGEDGAVLLEKIIHDAVDENLS